MLAMGSGLTVAQISEPLGDVRLVLLASRGGRSGTRRVMALGTAQGNIAAALVVASQKFSDPKVVGIVIVVSNVGMILLVALARAANR